MCKLIIGINKNQDNGAELLKIVKIQKEKVYGEHNGIAGMCLLNNGKLLVWRELVDYDKVWNAVLENIPKSKFFILHSRTSTGGYGNENVHLFENKGCLMAHNGTIPKLSNFHNGNGNNWKKNEDGTWKQGDFSKCDTLQFLEKIEKPLSASAIEKFVEENNMNGVAVMYDKQQKRAFLIAKRKPDLILLKDAEQNTQSALIFSYPPANKMKTKYYDKVFGIKIEAGEIEEEIEHETIESYTGVYEMEIE